ncbi:hypothetical protein FQN52_007940 [Onygenales sp. PD_12]|nr:hypothetical protein FQN52_007940 [Onygenales sp. PD_12]
MDSIPERALRDHHGPSGTYSPQKLFYQVKQAIISTVGPGYLEYTSVLPEVGYQVAQSLSVDPQVERSSVNLSYNPDTQILSVTMPTILHNSHLSWVNQQLIDATVSGFFTLQEVRSLVLSSNSRFDNFPAPYQNIYLEPDCFIRPRGAAFPTIVFAVGYSQTYSQLTASKNLWFTAAPTVNVVVIIKWSLISGARVEGFMELWRRGAANTHRIDIFPAPPPGSPPQTIDFYRGDLYVGGAVPAGRNANEVWAWQIDTLREIAEQDVRLEGKLPA